MAEKELRCSSCGKQIEAERDWVRFQCPHCNKAEILRCEKCKRMVNPYTCPKCKLRGP